MVFKGIYSLTCFWLRWFVADVAGAALRRWTNRWDWWAQVVDKRCPFGNCCTTPRWLKPSLSMCSWIETRYHNTYRISVGMNHLYAKHTKHKAKLSGTKTAERLGGSPPRPGTDEIGRFGRGIQTRHLTKRTKTIQTKADTTEAVCLRRLIDNTAKSLHI